ncbi:Putative dipeptide ABC transporter ATP-binding protein OS=Streptomyces griseus subsp. griseus (strain JCM 4626 / NBRC) OX=455632 GN=SGR_2037 PE=4 SV=1 [Streptomyces griseus subsp. griseus]
MIAHDLAVVRHISDVIGVMYLGGLVEEAPSDALYAGPRHPYTKALMSAVPVPDPEVEDRRERILLHGDLPSPANPPTGCRFHTRCPWVQETKCATERPPLLDTGDGHKVACHFTAEIEAGTVKQTLATGIEAVTGTETVAAEAVETAEGETPAGKPAAAGAPAEEPATVPAQADADATEQTEGSPKA